MLSAKAKLCLPFGSKSLGGSLIIPCFESGTWGIGSVVDSPTRASIFSLCAYSYAPIPNQAEIDIGSGLDLIC